MIELKNPRIHIAAQAASSTTATQFTAAASVTAPGWVSFMVVSAPTPFIYHGPRRQGQHRPSGVRSAGSETKDYGQGKGYGKALLRLMLEEARRMGITEEILVTVHPGNTASRRVAEANGGELRRGQGRHRHPRRG